ncbi:MAG TPA: glycosyltransferase family 39 protein [Pyrinomonadaceae bacterium]|nr:glycosyltransferase family 39 protein [Pyrinomonadaceae bacterium]
MYASRTRNPKPETRNCLSCPVAALVALYAAARLWRLTGPCLWFDEVFGVHAARHAWGGLWRFVAADLIHPPLFYALLKLWAEAGGESLLWLRLFPFVTSLGCVVPFLLLARELRLTGADARLALLLAATNGFLIKYAQEVRMYSLLLLLTLTSLWLFARYLNRSAKGNLIALFVFNLLLVYTHYYGWLVVACEAAFLILFRRRRLAPFALTVVVLVACFAPWAWACAEAAGEGGGLAQNIGWVGRPGPAQVAQLFALLHEPFYFRRSSAEPTASLAGSLAGLLLVALPVALLLVRTRTGTRDEAGRRGRDDEETRRAGDDDDEPRGGAEGRVGAIGFLTFFSLAPVALAFAASLLLPYSVWGTRHLIVVAGPYLLLAGAALARLRPAWTKAAALVLLACWLVLAGAAAALRREGVYVWCAWEGLAASLARDERGGSRPANVYAFEDLVAYHLWFALGDEERFRVAVVRGLPGVAEDPAYFLPRRFEGVSVVDPGALGGDSFWLAFRAASLDETRPPLHTLKGRGYRVERVYEAPAQGQRAFLVRVSLK